LFPFLAIQSGDENFGVGQILVLSYLHFAPKHPPLKLKPPARAVASISAAQESLCPFEMQRETRLSHADELLGNTINIAPFRKGENANKFHSKIYAWTKERLPSEYRSQQSRKSPD